MADVTPHLSLPRIQPAQAQKHVTHNEALRRLDALVQLSVLDRTRDTPPAAPQSGDRHIVGPAPDGAWAGQAGAVALWEGTWSFFAPGAGWLAYVVDEAQVVAFDGSAWEPLRPELQNLDGLGVGTASDAANPLAVAGPATLFTHDGAGHQVKVNKAAPAETASVLFQSAWSGRAEIGLAGEDALSVKVSADGTGWTEALRIEAAGAATRARQLRSGEITVASGAVGYVVTPAAGGLVALCAAQGSFPQANHAGLFAYDTGSSLMLVTLCDGGFIENLGTVTLTGSTASADRTGLAVEAGELQIENRSSGAYTYSYVFLG